MPEIVDAIPGKRRPGPKRDTTYDKYMDGQAWKLAEGTDYPPGGGPKFRQNLLDRARRNGKTATSSVAGGYVYFQATDRGTGGGMGGGAPGAVGTGADGAVAVAATAAVAGPGGDAGGGGEEGER